MNIEAKTKLGAAVLCVTAVTGLLLIGYLIGWQEKSKKGHSGSSDTSMTIQTVPPPSAAIPVKSDGNTESIDLNPRRELSSAVTPGIPSRSHVAEEPEELPLETDNSQHEPAQAELPLQDGPDYAKLLLKKDYLTEYLIEEADMNEFREQWNRAKSFYGVRNTEKQIFEACERIYQAKQFWPELKARDCLQYLVDKIPDKATISHTEYSSQTSAIIADPETQRLAGVADSQKIGITSLEIDLGNVRKVADQVYSELEYAYQKPILDAMQAQQAQRAYQEAQNAAIEAQIEANRTQRLEANAEAYNARQAAKAEAAAEQARRRDEWNANQAEMQRRMGLR